MKTGFFRKFILPEGPILALTLIGLLLLSASLYYQAVKIQRFLEPALAISQPRSEVARHINSLLLREFGAETAGSIRFSMGTVLVEESLLFNKDDTLKESSRAFMKKLSRFFMTALNDNVIQPHVGLIFVGQRFPFDPDKGSDNKTRRRMQRRAELILDSIYRMEPALALNYGTYFIPGAIPVNAVEKNREWIEFRIIPSEQVHIELLQRLHKYVR